MNLYFTWTSVFTLELGLQSKTAAFNLSLIILTKPSKCQAQILNKNSEELFPVSKRNCLRNKQSVWDAKQWRLLETQLQTSGN